ncbi:hypothetical protein NDU88_003631 [Pleurodeles waltl]|uniref:Uncharacterized protein n=1 Tax=Pleurodeles waltl TaxID=8319 RepID=A0AAV7T773_PLEWA|nr:hypothetical protein NDU88_003631 [Pleurodeles waltl]
MGVLSSTTFLQGDWPLDSLEGDKTNPAAGVNVDVTLQPETNIIPPQVSVPFCDNMFAVLEESLSAGAFDPNQGPNLVTTLAEAKEGENKTPIALNETTPALQRIVGTITNYNLKVAPAQAHDGEGLRIYGVTNRVPALDCSKEQIQGRVSLQRTFSHFQINPGTQMTPAHHQNFTPKIALLLLRRAQVRHYVKKKDKRGRLWEHMQGESGEEKAHRGDKRYIMGLYNDPATQQ